MKLPPSAYIALNVVFILVVSGIAWGYVHHARETPIANQQIQQASLSSAYQTLPPLTGPKIDVPPYIEDPVLDKARKMLAAIDAGNFAEAENIYKDVYAHSQVQNWTFYPYAIFINSIVWVNDPSLSGKIDAWVKQDSRDALPYLVRAQYEYEVGCFKRGNLTTDQIQEKDRKVFLQYERKALDDIDAAIGLDADNPYGYMLKLRILKVFNGATPEFFVAFKQGISKFPSYYPLYVTALETLSPKWGGSIQGMYAFVANYSGQPGSPMQLLYLDLYRLLLEFASDSCLVYWNDKDLHGPCISGTMSKITSNDMSKKIHAALQLYNTSDPTQFRRAYSLDLAAIVQTDDAEKYTEPVLQMFADITGSDTQLVEKDLTHHNDYMVDTLVGDSWFHKKFYSNAITKYQEALRDIFATPFPDDLDRNYAVMDAYTSLAETYDLMGQEDNTLAYSKAFEDISGSYYIMPCKTYFKTGRYEAAVSECGRLVDKTQNIEGYFWLGRAYEELGRWKDSVPNFAIVADSEAPERTSAAIDLSHVYFEQGDVQDALAVLNKYPYLYDEKNRDKQSLAAAYNNRCYGYMQLGELEKALADCTASLRFASMPDAYQKQQELIQKIKAQKSDSSL